MNIVDIIIIITLILTAFMGFIRGFFKETVMFLGTILIVILAFLLKNPLSIVLYKNLPFLKFGGIFNGLTSLNILMYEILAFIIAIAILSIALGIVVKLTGIIEKVLKLTIVLALPSKLLGMVVGLIQGVVMLYVVLFVLTLPILKIPYVSESKYANIILTKTPIMSKVTDGLVTTFDEVSAFTKDNINSKVSPKIANRNMVEIMLKNGVTTTESIELLVEKGKIEIDNVDELISKYKEEEK